MFAQQLECSENGVPMINGKLQWIPDMNNFGMVMRVEHCGYSLLRMCLSLHRLIGLNSFLWLNDWPLINIIKFFENDHVASRLFYVM